MNNLQGPDWAQVFEGSRLQCDLVAGVLESNGIEAVTPAASAEWVGAVFENSAVWVRIDEARRAREIIAEAERQEPGADG